MTKVVKATFEDVSKSYAQAEAESVRIPSQQQALHQTPTPSPQSASSPRSSANTIMRTGKPSRDSPRPVRTFIISLPHHGPPGSDQVPPLGTIPSILSSSGKSDSSFEIVPGARGPPALTQQVIDSIFSATCSNST